MIKIICSRKTTSSKVWSLFCCNHTVHVNVRMICSVRSVVLWIADKVVDYNFRVQIMRWGSLTSISFLCYPEGLNLLQLLTMSPPPPQVWILIRQDVYDSTIGQIYGTTNSAKKKVIRRLIQLIPETILTCCLIYVENLFPLSLTRTQRHRWCIESFICLLFMFSFGCN